LHDEESANDEDCGSESEEDAESFENDDSSGEDEDNMDDDITGQAGDENGELLDVLNVVCAKKAAERA
jgi:hypothetical protein